jgi:regulator of protease activity HflC (stomatin/prohibitin superfamily)
MLKMIERGTNALLAVGLGGLLVAGAAKQCIYVVDPGERAVLFDRFSGVKNKVSRIFFHFEGESPFTIWLQVYGEGMHFKIPFIQVSKSFSSYLGF